MLGRKVVESWDLRRARSGDDRSRQVKEHIYAPALRVRSVPETLPGMRCALLGGRMRTELPATESTKTNDAQASEPKRRCGNLSKMLAWRPPRELVERIEEWRARGTAAGDKTTYTMSDALEHLVEIGLERKEPED